MIARAPDATGTTDRRAGPAAADPPQGRPALLAWWEVVGLAAVVAIVATIVILDVHEGAVADDRRVVEAVAHGKAEQVARWLRERVNAASLSATSSPQAALFAAWQASGDPEARDALTLRLSQVAAAGGFAGVALLGPEGRTLWTGGDAAPGAARRPTPAPAVTGLATPPAPVPVAAGAATLQAPYWDPAGHLHVAIHAPLPVAAGPGPIVVFRVGETAFRSTDLVAWPTAAATGRITVFHRSGERLEAFGPRGPAALEAGTAAAWSMAADDPRWLPARLVAGLVAEGRTERGLLPDGTRVWGAAVAVRDSDWYLLATIDEAEVASHLSPLVSFASLLAVLVVAIGSLLLALLRQRERWAVMRAGQAAATERRRATDLLGAIADASSDAIYAKDLDGRYILFNAAAAGMVGRSGDDVLGADDATLFPPDQAATLRAIDREAAGSDRPRTGEVRLTTVLGPRVVQATNGPLRDEHGRLYGTFGIARDITDRAAAELALADKGEQLERTVHELQRFNDAMVDRELAMIELKRQLNVLADRLGISVPHPFEPVPSPDDG